jgi:mRNA interferase MazF
MKGTLIMKQGDICLTKLGQADGSEKLRPTLLLSRLPGYGDWLVCGISSQVHKISDNWDVFLKEGDPIFLKTGLKKSSIVRLSFLATAPSNTIAGKIGSLPIEIVDTINNRICSHLMVSKQGSS